MEDLKKNIGSQVMFLENTTSNMANNVAYLEARIEGFPHPYQAGNSHAPKSLKQLIFLFVHNCWKISTKN